MSKNEIQITTADSGEPFLFASYKSQNQEVVEKILYRLQKHYGLRVYYDKEFARENSPWYDLMAKQLNSFNCKGLLAFGSEEYVCSYACLMELLYFRTVGTIDESEEFFHIIPISLDPKRRLISDIKPRKEYIQPTTIQPGEINFIRKNIIENMRTYKSHLVSNLPKDKVEHFEALLDDIDVMLLNIQNTRGEFRPHTAKRWMSEFFQIMGENINFYYKKTSGALESAAPESDIEGLCDQLVDTIRNPAVCGESVFDPAIVAVPAAVPAPAVASVVPAPAEVSEPVAIPAAPAVTPVIVPTASAPVNQPPVTQATEIPLSRFAGSVRPDMTLADFRTLATDGAFCQVLGQLRRDGTLFPRQRGLFDYAMLSILGGCNAMAFPYQQNYYDWAVANLDRKLESAKRTADWTWSSNARKVVGLEKSGRLDAAFNAPFETISDQTTLAQMQEAFLRNASTEYHTKDNAAVSRVFDILYQQLG